MSNGKWSNDLGTLRKQHGASLLASTTPASPNLELLIADFRVPGAITGSKTAQSPARPVISCCRRTSGWSQNILLGCQVASLLHGFPRVCIMASDSILFNSTVLQAHSMNCRNWVKVLFISGCSTWFYSAQWTHNISGLFNFLVYVPLSSHHLSKEQRGRQWLGEFPGIQVKTDGKSSSSGNLQMMSFGFPGFRQCHKCPEAAPRACDADSYRVPRPKLLATFGSALLEQSLGPCAWSCRPVPLSAARNGQGFLCGCSQANRFLLNGDRIGS